MLGVIVNTVAVFIGGSIGMLLKKGFSENLSRAIMETIGLCSIYIGISGALQGNNVLVLIFAMVFGTITGTVIDIDGWITRIGNRVQERFPAGADGVHSVAEGFVSASLLFCIGAMTIVGSLQAGLSGDNTMLYTKSLLDFCSSMMLAASMGIGVVYSAAFVLVFQGAIALMAGVLAPLLSDAAIAEMICAGSVMIVAIGLNVIGVTKIKVANQLPGIVFAPIFLAIYTFAAGLLAGFGG